MVCFLFWGHSSSYKMYNKINFVRRWLFIYLFLFSNHAKQKKTKNVSMASSFSLYFAQWLIEWDHFSSRLYWPKSQLNRWYHLWDITTGYHSVNPVSVAHRWHWFSEGLPDIVSWDWKWSHSINHRAQRVRKLTLIMETRRLINCHFNCKSRGVWCL